MSVKTRVQHKPAMRKPLGGRVGSSSKGVPTGMFSTLVARAIVRAAAKAQRASMRPTYNKVVYSGRKKPAVAQKGPARKVA